MGKKSNLIMSTLMSVEYSQIMLSWIEIMKDFDSGN